MSLNATALQFSEAMTRFLGGNPEVFLTSGPVFLDFDGPNVLECVDQIAFLRHTYEPLISSGELTLIAKTAFSNLIVIAQNVHNTFTALVSSRDQNSFQNFSMAIDGFVHNTRMYGIPYLTAGGAQLEVQRKLLADEVLLLTRNNAEVEVLKNDVRTLITPAIAGSLSEAFRQRRDSLYKGRVLWLWISGGLALLSFAAAYEFVLAVTATLKPLEAQIGGQSFSIWLFVAVRTIFLFPIFAAFGFAFSQYRKERDFEEEYAHKAAVANSLPNYGDLAREQTVRDQITTAATSVIFSSPTEQARKAETNGALLVGMRELVEAASKGLSKK